MNLGGDNSVWMWVVSGCMAIINILLGRTISHMDKLTAENKKDIKDVSKEIVDLGKDLNKEISDFGKEAVPREEFNIAVNDLRGEIKETRKEVGEKIDAVGAGVHQRLDRLIDVQLNKK